MPPFTFEDSALAAEDLDRTLAEVAEGLEGDLDELSARVAEQIHSEMPEFGSHARVTDRTRAVVRANLASFLELMREGVPTKQAEVSSDTVEYARAFVRRRIPLELVMRCFRLGHAHMWTAWAVAIDACDLEPDTRTTVLEVVSASMFDFIDQTTTALVTEYLAERERWNRSAEARRAESVAEILAGGAVDVDAASRALGYDLRRWHVGVVLWSEDEDAADDRLTTLQHAAADIAEGIASSQRPLVLASEGASLWAWVGSTERPADEAVAAATEAARSDGISVGLGEPAKGVEGFRHTHERALLTRKVMRLTGSRPGNVRRYGSLALTAVLSADVDLMRAFVADELGELSADDDATSRLRSTLLVYFEEDLSASRTGRRLSIHRNTVNYRVKRCVELLGRPVRERRVELEVALLLREGLKDVPFEG